jgi:chromosome segregation ATPase
MKSSFVCVFALSMLFLVVPEKAMGQSTPGTRPTSEQSLQELVKEIRQLRATLQRMNATAYKAQVMLERLKFQQEQVARVSRDLTHIRESISEMRAQQLRMKELVSRAETGAESGFKNPADLAGLKAELEMVNQREQRLSARETQLANELLVEQAKLNELNDRLNALELEMAPK